MAAACEGLESLISALLPPGREHAMSELDEPSKPPVWQQWLSDQTSTKPPTWGDWKARYRRWAWPLSFEWVVHWSRHWDFVRVLELAGRFTILSVAVTWFFEFDNHERARQDAIKMPLLTSERRPISQPAGQCHRTVYLTATLDCYVRPLI